MCKPLWPLMLVLLAAGTASARPEHKESLKRHYGTWLAKSLFACATCHDVPAGVSEEQLAEEAPPHNDFGERLRVLGEELAANEKPADLITRLKLVAGEDADGDGAANELELLSGNAPGNADDRLAADQLPAARALQEKFARQYRWEPFKTVVRPALPAASSEAAAGNPIDAFLAVEHAARGLQPRPEAPPHVLLRRLYLDLIGLPPTRAELHAFLADRSPGAYEKVVDRLLADPRYGERWGRHWMDVWRYSDWAGYGKQVRDSQPHIWRWRDWIVESLVADLPYDQMIVQMLAADELLPEDPSAVRATGYLARNYKRLSREQWLQDTVDHTFLAFQGLTVKCARCHDHMYDPVSQKEYYRLRAIFEPHQVRIDRIPGVADTALDGLPRVYDAELKAVTYFYHRGDERTPDKEQPMAPGVPAAIEGPEFAVEPVALPLAAHSPDQRDFVIEETIAASTKSIADAKAALKAAVKKHEDATSAWLKVDTADVKAVLAARQALEASLERLQLARLDVPLTEARDASLTATLAVEQMEKEDADERDKAAWEKAATAALSAQRKAALLESQRALVAAEQAHKSAKNAFEAAEARLAEKKDEAAGKQAVQKAKTALEAADKKLAEVNKQFAAAQEALAKPLSTDYAKRSIATYPASSTGRRLALARWIADRRNALTARVAVNHIWLRHFGQPLVESVFDFGQNGRVPEHPALVDWLAAEFMEPTIQTTDADLQPADWSMKHLHRLIVTSAAYRRHSTTDASNQAIDSENRYLWCFPSRRLEAEAVRDCVLYVAGQLDLTRGGPDIDHAKGMTSRRRSLYFRHAAEKQMEMLKLFDAAAVNECYQRKESIVPQQALALANSELTIVGARLLARMLADETSADNDAFIRAAFEQLLARPVTDQELETCRQFLAEQNELFQQHAGKLNVVAADASDGSKPAADIGLRARENLVHVLLNHHEFVTIR